MGSIDNTRFRVRPGGKIGLAAYDPAGTSLMPDKAKTAEAMQKDIDQINRFEQNATDTGAAILKFFLHISKDEQKRRLEARLSSPKKNWKFKAGDLEERELWGDYQAAYEDALNRCSTEAAPWYIIPADHKWYRNWMVATTIVERLKSLNPKYPRPAADLSKIRIT